MGGDHGPAEQSPGPIYKYSMNFLSEGESGMGPEYSIRPSFRAPYADKKTTQADRPGPKYNMPNGLGKQVESTKRSFNVGKFSESKRITFSGLQPDSPGPAAYDRGALGLKTVARQEKIREMGKGMGCAERFFNKETRTGAVPGPGAYKLPSSIGGNHPSNHSKPVFAFGKDGARHAHSIEDPSIVDPCSPGPHAKYGQPTALGVQASGHMKTMPRYGFGTSSRFPVSPQENREHQEQVKKIKKMYEARAEARLARSQLE